MSKQNINVKVISLPDEQIKLVNILKQIILKIFFAVILLLDIKEIFLRNK